MISQDIINQIIDYLPYHKQKQINKYYYKKINKLHKKTINKIYNFYINNKNRIEKILEDTNFFRDLNKNHLQIVRAFYILNYPDEYKEDYMILTLFNSQPLNYNSLKIIYYNHDLSLQRKFKMFINRLNINELKYIGW